MSLMKDRGSPFPWLFFSTEMNSFTEESYKNQQPFVESAFSIYAKLT